MTTNGNHFRVVDKAQERYAMAGKRDVHMRTMDDTEVTNTHTHTHTCTHTHTHTRARAHTHKRTHTHTHTHSGNWSIYDDWALVNSEAPPVRVPPCGCTFCPQRCHPELAASLYNTQTTLTLFLCKQVEGAAPRGVGQSASSPNPPAPSMPVLTLNAVIPSRQHRSIL